MKTKKSSKTGTPDVVLIGAGIMSATLGVLLKKLNPSMSISIFERLDRVTAESSDPWNNAGTGHSAFCELNYTPQLPDGSVEIKKAIQIAESFEVSKEFWAYLVENEIIDSPDTFIHNIPHMSFVWGNENVEYLHKRFEALSSHHLFRGMEYTEDKEVINNWVPLVMTGRDPEEKVAATRMQLGTDVNFGMLTKYMFDYLEKQNGVNLCLNHEVSDLSRNSDSSWTIEVKNRETNRSRDVKTKFVFIGAGGGSLLLLEKSNIPEGKGFGGFPVSGQWLVCNKPEIIEQHQAKVYGKASVGSPPMSVPHLDTRVIDGKKALLFGPYAGFSTKFLKNGSYLDLPSSIKLNNIKPMLAAGIHNIPLTKYLIDQVRQSPEDRLEALKEYLPEARLEDWELEKAGQRVQVIKKDKKEGGVLEFGTEMVTAADGSLAALLGASPGASTSVSIMIDLIHRCFKEAKTDEWQDGFRKIIPSFGSPLSANEDLAAKTRAWTTDVLQLNASHLEEGITA
ncbi:malate:quinone oxidoreductase [Dyadobacter arcticus]|uniref:Probable malate:quinone oxidoreductase n=1 Tax=Dyadobacter arcticus TaxID=1078754 RepID=A0ABX0UFN7_9BACT|nr:malate:quinone oxidoreductase [Dyadobacter arcticus]NIJ51502.1 malate dehydrogenase (quinone) [Dyadobacter arcticus]